MIRKRPDGSIERYDVEGGELIDENGDFDIYGNNALDQETIDSELDEVKWRWNDIRKK